MESNLERLQKSTKKHRRLHSKRGIAKRMGLPEEEIKLVRDKFDITHRERTLPSKLVEPHSIKPEFLLPKKKYELWPKKSGIQFWGHTKNDRVIIKYSYDLISHLFFLEKECKNNKVFTKWYYIVNRYFQFNRDIYETSRFVSNAMRELGVHVRLRRIAAHGLGPPYHGSSRVTSS